MNLFEFNQKFGSEKKCKRYLKKLRESNGVKCTRCKSLVKNWRSDNEYWRCSCGSKISLKKGTVMEASNLKVDVWFKAIFLLVHTKKSYSILELSRILGIKRYRTVWYLTMKLRVLMGNHLMLRKYLQFKVLFTRENDLSLYNFHLKNKSICAQGIGDSNGVHSINLLAHIELQQKADILEIKLLKGNYRCGKILGTTNNIELGEESFAFRKSKKIWLQKIIANSSRLLQGVHHGVHLIHVQKYLFEFSFKYNYRKGDKFNELIKIAF